MYNPILRLFDNNIYWEQKEHKHRTIILIGEKLS